MPNGHPTATALTSDRAFLADVLRSEGDALLRLAKTIESDELEASRWVHAVSLIDACTGHVVVAGMGKSGLIGAKISATLSSVGVPSHFIHPADAVHGDLGRIKSDDVVLLLSFSGGTEEVIHLGAILRTDGVTRIGISKSHDSRLAGLCDVHLALGDLDEAGNLSLAPTTSTTATLACGDALAMAVAHRRAFTEEDFQRRHPGGALGAVLRPVQEILRFKVGENLSTCHTSDLVRAALEQSESQHTSGATRHAGALLVVDDDGMLAGILTDGDVRRLALKKHDFLDCAMGDVMTPQPLSIPATARVAEARGLVTEYRIDEIPVVDEHGRPIGLVDIQDILAPRITSS